MFAIRHDALLAFFTECQSLPAAFLGLLRPLRLGWLKRHRIGIVRGLFPMTTEDMARVTRKRRKRLVADEEQWRNNLDIPDYLDDVWDFPDGPFSLFDGDKHLGMGFKTTDPDGSKRLYWLKLRDITRFFHRIEEHLIKTAQRYAIPPDDYCNHPTLVP